MARIVLIDDDEILAELLVEHLQAAGHMASAVHTGDEGLLAIDASVQDLIILDYDLPDVTGMHILSEVRARAHLEAVPIMMVTAKRGNLLLARAHEGGVDDYLRKPVSANELLARAEAILSCSWAAGRVRAAGMQ